jgi:hypothetical protein
VKTIVPLLLVALLVALLAACGPGLREPATVKPRQIAGQCGVREGAAVDEAQALCIAGLAGLRVGEGECTIRAATSSSRAPTWVIDEVCGAANPRCIGIVVSQTTGTILDTRYLYAVRELERDSR